MNAFAASQTGGRGQLYLVLWIILVVVAFWGYMQVGFFGNRLRDHQKKKNIIFFSFLCFLTGIILAALIFGYYLVTNWGGGLWLG